jgi:hypothetical protein
MFIIDAQPFSNSFKGGTWGCEKIWEGGVLYFRVLLQFCNPFLKSFEGVHKVAPPPPPLPLLASMLIHFYLIEHYLLSFILSNTFLSF